MVARRFESAAPLPRRRPHRNVAHRYAVRAAAGLLALLFAAPAGAQTGGDTVTVSLSEAVARALSVSPDVQEVEAEVDFAQARSRLARASRFLTEFNATTAHSAAPALAIPEDNTFPREAVYLNPDVRNDWDDLRPINRLEVDLVQPLFTWGELGGNIRAARHGVAVEEAALERRRLEVAYRTAELYYNILLADALFRLAEDTGAIIDRAKEEIDRLLQEGAEDVDDADLFKVRLTEQEYRRRVAEVVQSRLTARTALARQLFLDEGALALPGDSALAPLPFAADSLDALFALALANRPELAQAEAGLAARTALVEVARSDYYPKLFIGAEARYMYAAGRYNPPTPYIGDPYLSRSVRAGLGLRQKLTFFQTRARVEQAEAERDEVRHQLEGARQLILFEVERAYRDLLTAREGLDAQAQALTISREWLRTEQINFDLDLGDTENLVDAVQASLELQARYYEAVRAHNLAVLRLLRATGVLLTHLESGTLVD